MRRLRVQTRQLLAPSLKCAATASAQNLAETLANDTLFVDERRRAAKALGDMGEAAAPYAGGLAAVLANKTENGNWDFTLRWDCAHALKHIGKAAAPFVQDLAKALADDPDSSVRRASAIALGHIGEAAAPYVHVIADALANDSEAMDEDKWDGSMRRSILMVLAAVGHRARRTCTHRNVDDLRHTIQRTEQAKRYLYGEVNTMWDEQTLLDAKRTLKQCEVVLRLERACNSRKIEELKPAIAEGKHAGLGDSELARAKKILQEEVGKVEDAGRAEMQRLILRGVGLTAVGVVGVVGAYKCYTYTCSESVPLPKVTADELWKQLKGHEHMQVAGLKWRCTSEANVKSALLRHQDDMYQFIWKNWNKAPPSGRQVTRIEMLHNNAAEQQMLACSKMLRLGGALNPENPQDQDSKAGLATLKANFLPKSTSASSGVDYFVGFHGTGSKFAMKIASNGPRSLRQTDGGYFASGPYVALEAEYAAKYASWQQANNQGEYCVLVFLCVVSSASVLTRARDYTGLAQQRYGSDYEGFSDFFALDGQHAVAMKPRCDAHFVPVKDFGLNSAGKHLDFQCCPDGEATAHELVLGGFNQMAPIAILYFK